MSLLSKLASVLVGAAVSLLIDEPGVAIKSVFVKDNEVFTLDAVGGAPQQITHDGSPKALPVWSPDGTRVAFLRGSRTADNLTLVVLSQSGVVEREMALSSSQLSGMRFIERAEWNASSRLILSGSINPSTVEHDLIDPRTGQPEGSYLSDGFCMALSGDGEHVAYHSQIPHFTPEASRRPRLCIDAECAFDRSGGGYPGPEVHWEFPSCPVWNSAGTEVADLARVFPTGAYKVIVRQVGERTSVYPLPWQGDSNVRLAWQGLDLFILSADSGWRLPAGANTLIPDDGAILRRVWMDAEKRRKEFQQSLSRAGARDSSIWCRGCSVQDLPKTPNAE